MPRNRRRSLGDVWRTVRARSARSAIALSFALALGSCRNDATAPPGPPYIAIEVLSEVPAGIAVPGPFTYRIREMSGTLGVDLRLQSAPNDTVYTSVPAEGATYLVEMSGVPAICGVRAGPAQVVVVVPNANTRLVRFSVTCFAPLTIETLTDGVDRDSAFVYTVVGTGVDRSGVIGANALARLDALPAGDYEITLRHVAAHCVVTSDGGSRQRIVVDSAGGARVAFRVVCSDARKRPRITSFAATYHDSAAAFTLTVVDPDRDVERYTWAITDCQGRSLLPESRFLLRRGLSSRPSVAYRDTAVILGVFERALPDAAAAGARCQGIRVADEQGNVSDLVEVPLVPGALSSRPRATLFTARLVGTSAIRVLLAVEDDENDFVGTYSVYETRDGIVIRPPDGIADRLVFEVAGLVGQSIPDLPLGTGLGNWDDYYGVTVYLIDRRGNFTRLDDRDLFR